MASNRGGQRLRNEYILIPGVFGTENTDCAGLIMVAASLLFDLDHFPSACIQCTNLENQLGYLDMSAYPIFRLHSRDY